MDYTTDILARLQKGSTVEEIAEELTRNLNEANKQYIKIQEEKKQSHLDENKIAYADCLLDCIYDLLSCYNVDDALLKVISDLPAEDLVKTLDAMMPFIQEYARMMLALKREECAPSPARAPSGDPIRDFLDKYVK